MPGRHRRARAALALTLVLATSALVVASSQSASSQSGHPTTPVVELVPLAISIPSLAGVTPPTTASCLAKSDNKDACYDPAQLRVAYELAPLYAAGIEGQHQTIVIVDCYGSPTIAADLGSFDKAFGLPAPPSFKILRPVGAIPPFSPSGRDRLGWALETSLDVEWAHALAPRASILLVETPTDEVEGTSGFPDIVRAEKVVIARRLGTVISQSFGATEQTFSSFKQLSPLRAAFLAAAKATVTVLGGSGDLGATDFELNAKTIYPYRVTSWPASDPLVTAVGGTKLDLNGQGRPLQPAAAWNDTYEHSPPAPRATGGGRSVLFTRPSYQSSVASVTGAHRGVPDIAMSAACSGLVDVYVSFKGPGSVWSPACGTSEATPLFAAIVALSDQEAGHGLGPINPALYALTDGPSSGLVAVTSGNNTVGFENGSSGIVTVTGFQASASYNLVTGLGTIDAARFVPALVREWKLLNPKH
ncbi:MAG TPA: S53 family peptidase [Acidimicrobiales bacterium]|nr:S53 family peptidase [Acidimicrobiales bacterium]